MIDLSLLRGVDMKDVNFHDIYHEAMECYEVEQRAIPNVHSIEIRGGVDVFFKTSDTPKLAIASNNAELFKDIKTVVENGVLIISRTSKSIYGSNVQINYGGGNVQIINGNGNVQIGGALDRVVVGLSLPYLLEACIIGSADLALLDVKQESLSLVIKGSGDIKASGEVSVLRCLVKGSGDVRAKRLKADKASLKVLGSGDIRVCVLNEVSAHVSGSGDIKVYGNPSKRDASNAGSGRVKFK